MAQTQPVASLFDVSEGQVCAEGGVVRQRGSGVERGRDSGAHGGRKGEGPHERT